MTDSNTVTTITGIDQVAAKLIEQAYLQDADDRREHTSLRGLGAEHDRPVELPPYRVDIPGGWVDARKIGGAFRDGAVVTVVTDGGSVFPTVPDEAEGDALVSRLRVSNEACSGGTDV